MLRMLEQDRPDQVAEIHRAAAKYYHDESGAAARGEELYHLLQLDSDRATLDAAWTTEAERFVMPSRAELPPRAQAYLASKTNTDLDPAIRAQADLEEWEMITEGKVRELIRLGGLGTAQSMLGERKDRTPGSPLFPLEGTILILMKRYSEAEALLQRGIDSVGSTDRLYPLLEMVRARGDLYAQTGRTELAEQEYLRAEELAERLSKGVLQLQILLDRVILQERIGRAKAPPTPESVAYLNRILASIRDADLLAARGQLTGLFRTLGPDYPELLNRGLSVFSLQGIPVNLIGQFPQSTTAALNATEPARALARKAASELSVAFEESLLTESDAPWPQIMLQAGVNQRLNEFVSRALAEAPADKALHLWIVDLLEAAIGPVNQLAQAPGMRGFSSRA
jgi:tetratricopeptide (TPR) repeat protein